MGTLGGYRERLPEYCEHKLPTSCVLSSMTNCCACADTRGHAPSYPTYVDGVGFVPRGTRWQRYCWYCCTFWENRVKITDLEASRTKIPERPEQAEFLERWYEFHRGYRIVKSDSDGGERRIAVLGEPWKEVTPGHLPRTLDELRAGAARSGADRLRHYAPDPSDGAADAPALEETLDNLLSEAERESLEAQRGPSIRTQVATDIMTARDWQQRHMRSLRAQRAAEGFRRVFGTREDVEAEDYVSPITRMFTRAWDRHRHLEELRQRGEQSEPIPMASRAHLPTPEPEIPQGLDVDPSRPEPKTAEQMTFKLDCKVCFTQRADTVFIPCGHLIMCHWCSEQHCPSMPRDRTRPRNPTTCPLCRKPVKQRYAVKMS